MIMYLPEIYPDELVYSWLARYYIQTGYVRYAFVAEELFQSKTVRPDIEFVNQYTASMLQAITEKSADVRDNRKSYHVSVLWQILAKMSVEIGHIQQ